MPVYPLRNNSSVSRKSHKINDKRIEEMEHRILAVENRISKTENKLKGQVRDLDRLKNDFESNM